MNQYKYTKKNNVTIKGVVHIGAHRGEELLEYEKLGAKNVVWVEANPDVYEELQENLKRNHQCTVSSKSFCVACSDKDDEEVDFHIIYGHDAQFMEGNKGASSLLSPTPNLSSKLPVEHIKTIKQKTITIDSLLERNNLNASDYDMLDLDIQGAEMLALKGAANLLNEVNYISSEITWNDPYYKGNTMSTELISFLEEKGFKYVEVKYHAKTWGDALFVRV